MRWREIARKLGRMMKPAAEAVAVGVVAFAILWKVQYASPAPIDWDIYYHLKFVQITAERGLIREFPWCQFSLFKDHFADKDFLFHVLLVPFVRHDLFQAGKLFPIWFGALIAVSLYLILRSHKVVYPWLWLVLLFCWTPTFLFRFVMPRPHLVAILMFVVMTHALIAEKRLLLFAAACLFPLTHAMAVLIWILPLLYELNRWRVEKRFEWRTVGVTAAGLVVGFLLHPNFPNNVRVLYIQGITIPRMLWFGRDLRFGMEFMPFDTRAFLLQSYFPLALNALSLFVALTRRYDLDRKIGFLLAMNLGVFVVTMLSKRFIEFLVPVNVLFLGLVFSREITGQSLEAVSARLGVKRLIGLAVLVAGFLVLSAYHHYRSLIETISRSRPPSYRQAAMWLLTHAKPGEIVFTADWDDMPQLFFYNDKNYYLNVLDPAFMYCWNAEVWREWTRIVRGMKSNTYGAIRDGFRSEYVFASSDMRDFIMALLRDPRFEPVHRDQWCVLFRLREEPFDFFLSNWTVAGPYTRDHDQELIAAAGSEQNVFQLGHGDKPTTVSIVFESLTSGVVTHGFVDLQRQFGAGTTTVRNAAAYARATFDCPTSGPALLHLGFDDGAAAWLNQERVFYGMQPGSAMPDEHSVEVKLRPGANILDVKVYQFDLDWGFYCWLTDDVNAKVLVQTEHGGVWKERKEQPKSAPATEAASAEPRG